MLPAAPAADSYTGLTAPCTAKAPAQTAVDGLTGRICPCQWHGQGPGLALLTLHSRLQGLGTMLSALYISKATTQGMEGERPGGLRTGGDSQAQELAPCLHRESHGLGCLRAPIILLCRVRQDRAGKDPEIIQSNLCPMAGWAVFRLLLLVWTGRTNSFV